MQSELGPHVQQPGSIGVLADDPTELRRASEMLLFAGRPVEQEPRLAALAGIEPPLVLGEPVDGKGPVETDTRLPIHREAPPLVEQSTESEMFETGIKVVDLLEPYTKGGKTGLFGGAGVGLVAAGAGLVAAGFGVAATGAAAGAGAGREAG